MVISRPEHAHRVRWLLKHNPVVAILGPRQIGKSTLARQIADERRNVTMFDLERPADLRRLEDPERVLGPLKGLVVLDEVQRRPEIFPVLRVLVDRPRSARFLVLGSAAPQLLAQSSETLAGRIAFHPLDGLDLAEVSPRNLGRLWLRGGFPRSYTASSGSASLHWRRDFIQTFLERDLPMLGIRTAEPTMRRFWSMLAHVHGSTLNWSELGRSMGVSDMTVRHYLDSLSATFVIRQLQPWFENISKRQVKSPKVYVSDSGLLHALLDIENQEQLDGHPKVGASWEGFVVAQVVRRLGARPEQCYFWATHAGAELDLLVIAGGRRLGFEIKLTTAPAATASVRTALADLKLERVDVVHAGTDTYPLSDRVRAVAAERILDDLKPLG
ncbi:MAG TPA: ATP-binding protein [Kofleriaceae bacterium]|nr:ATP-binding protein [Kofleriaceae bacterium]